MDLKSCNGEAEVLPEEGNTQQKRADLRCTDTVPVIESQIVQQRTLAHAQAACVVWRCGGCSHLRPLLSSQLLCSAMMLPVRSNRGAPECPQYVQQSWAMGPIPEIDLVVESSSSKQQQQQQQLPTDFSHTSRR